MHSMRMTRMITHLIVTAILLAYPALAWQNRRWGEKIKAATDAITNNSTQVPAFNEELFKPANTTILDPEFFLNLGSQRAMLSYGPFATNPMNESNGMVDYLEIGAAMPCVDCTITYIHAELQYPDGSYANANTSLWLHHVVFIQYKTPDVVCGSNFYGQGQRWFASGNERTPVNLSKNGTIPAGYYWGKGEMNIFLLELMNQAMYPQDAVLTVTYEWIPGKPEHFYNILPMWLDISGCYGESDEPVLSDTSFNYESPTYSSQISGAIISMGGHLHDGGVYLDIVRNGTVECQPHAYYGQTAGYWDQAGVVMTMNSTETDDQMEMGDMRMPHISSIGYCYAPAGFVELGDSWGVNAYYNFSEWAPMLDTDGSYTEIMGISVMYVAENMTAAELESFVGAAAPNAYPDGHFVPEISPLSSLADMTCVPMRDSPGTLSATNLNLQDYEVAMLYLSAILDDACLQVWSEMYARGFWYGILVVIVLSTLVNRGQKLRLAMRTRSAAAGKSVWDSRGIFSRLPTVARAITYVHITPTKMPHIVRLPTLGTTLMIGAYIAFICIMDFVNTNTHDDQRWQSVGIRAAWLSVAQIPLIVVLAMKRNLVGFVTGVTYERLNVLHRWTSRGLLLTATFHVAFQNYGWSRLGLMKLEWSVDECTPTGLAAYVLLVWLNITTIAPFRNFGYEFFVVQHILSFMGFIIAVTYHIPSTALSARTYVFIAVGLYLGCRLLQATLYIYHNIRPARASVTAVGADVTKITVRGSNITSYAPGTHVLLRIPAISVLQSHPATIASTPTSHDGNLVFFLRAHKGFSAKLYRRVASSARGTGSSGDDNGTLTVLLDGPYGGAQPDFAAFHTTILIASSTGITFVLPILLSICARARAGIALPVRTVRVVWVVKDAAATKWVPRELNMAIADLLAAGIDVNVAIHVTGAYDEETHANVLEEKIMGLSEREPEDVHGVSEHRSETSDDIVDNEKKETYVRVAATRSQSASGSDTGSGSEPDTKAHNNGPQLFTVHKGRPQISSILRTARDEAQGEVGVAVCGSLELSSDVRRTVARLQFGGGNGMFLHVEGFGW